MSGAAGVVHPIGWVLIPIPISFPIPRTLWHFPDNDKGKVAPSALK